MGSESDRDLEERVARLEETLADLARTVREIRGEPREADQEPARSARLPGPPGAAPRGPGAPRAPRAPRPPTPPRDLFAPGSALLSRVGIFLLILAVAFFFKYSIDQGWLVPGVRIGIGLATGVLLLVLGWRGAGRGEALGTALAGGAIATFFITGYAAHQWYSLMPYPVAFGVLFWASALGIGLSLKSNRQALAIVGLIGALSTPFILTAVAPRLAGLIAYLCLVAGTVAAVYMARAWRLLFLLGAAATWQALMPALAQARGTTGGNMWTVEAGIVFCALLFWMVPIVRAQLHALDAGRWPRPTAGVMSWSTHLDSLSIVIPLAAILSSVELWRLSQAEGGWVFLGTAALAMVFGGAIARSGDAEGSSDTQRFVALLLALVGMGMVLDGDVRYLAYIGVAIVASALGTSKGDRVLGRFSHIAMLVVAGFFLDGLAAERTLQSGDWTSLVDLVAIGAAVFVGTRGFAMRPSDGEAPRGRFGLRVLEREIRGLYLFAAYVGVLAWTLRELTPLEHGPALASLGLGLEGAALLVAGFVMDRKILQKTGMATLLLVVVKLLVVDLQAIDPVWRVLLFSLIGVLLLGLSRFIQGRRVTTDGD